MHHVSFDFDILEVRSVPLFTGRNGVRNIGSLCKKLHAPYKIWKKMDTEKASAKRWPKRGLRRSILEAFGGQLGRPRAKNRGPRGMRKRRQILKSRPAGPGYPRTPPQSPRIPAKSGCRGPPRLSLTIKTNRPQHALHHCKAVGGGSNRHPPEPPPCLPPSKMLHFGMRRDGRNPAEILAGPN